MLLEKGGSGLLAKKPETVFKDRIRPLLEALPWTFVIKIQQEAIHGDPDFVLVVNGSAVYIELKKSTAECATPLQLDRLRRAERAGAYAFVVSPETWEPCFSFLQSLAIRPKPERVPYA